MAVLSAMVREAEREPAATGTKTTLIVQDCCGGTAWEAPVQLSVSEKSPAFEPENVRPLMTSVPLPVFETVMGKALLEVPTNVAPKESCVGEVTTTACVPVPASAAVCGEEEELSATESEAEREPVAVGAKVMEMTQEALGFKEPGQLWVS